MDVQLVDRVDVGQLNSDRLNAVASFGLTDRQARFLVTVMLHSGVFVAKLCRVGRFAWLLPRVVLTNDPTPPSDRLRGCVVGDYAVVAAGALILPGVELGAGSLVAAKACVGIDVPPAMVAMGVPARVTGRTIDIHLRGDPASPAYPWQLHFHRGYPPELVRAWMEEPIADPKDNDAP